MLSYNRAYIVLLMAFLLVCGADVMAITANEDGRSVPAPRVEVPIKITYDLNGYIRFSILVSMDDSEPFEALLDTGSAGLRILPDVVPYSNFILTDERIRLGFANGMVLDGNVALSTVKIGDLTTPTLIAFQAVDAVSCDDAAPNCTAKNANIKNFLLGGTRPDQGFRAIIGVSMKNHPDLENVVSPLAQLPGNGSFIIKIPYYGALSGTLVINPNQFEREKFTFFKLDSIPLPLPNDLPAWADKKLPGCLINQSKGESYCAPTVIDTGSPDAQILWSFGHHTFDWPAGTKVLFKIGNEPDHSVQAAFTVGSAPLSGWDKIVTIPFTKVPNGLALTPDGINLLHPGLMVFFRFDVFYDQKNGLIGFSKHAD